MCKYAGKIYKNSANERIVDLIGTDVKSILDIGCGTGNLCQEFSSRSVIIDGITISDKEADFAGKFCRRVWKFNIENGLPDLDRKYDVIVLSHVLEHISNPNPLVRSLNSALNNNGKVVIAIPNMLFIYNRFKLLIGRIEYEEYGIMDYTHVRWYTQDTLVNLFVEHGFIKESFKATGNLPLGPLRKIVGKKISSWLDNKLIGLFPGLFAWEFAFKFIKGEYNAHFSNNADISRGEIY